MWKSNFNAADEYTQDKSFTKNIFGMSEVLY